VPRRGTCKGVRAGSVGWGRRWGTRGGRVRAASGDRGEGHGWRPRPRVMAGRRCWRWSRRAVMRVGSRDRSESRVRSVWARVSRSTCVPSSRSWTWRVHSGSRASWRLLSGATSVCTPSVVAGQPVGHTEADEALDGPPRAPAPCGRRAQAEGLAKLTQVDHGWFAFAPQHGQRRRTSSAEGPMTAAQTCST
jgi:hypothetical protein